MINSVRVLVLVAVVITTATTSFAGENTGGFGIGPGMAMVENVRPGGEKAGGGTYTVNNGTDKPQIFTVSVKKISSALQSWEKGYLDIPDISFCSLDKEEIELPAKSEGKVNLFIKVPDKPEYYNQKWMVAVACSPGKAQEAKAGVVGLAVVSRVQIETLADPLVKASYGDTWLIPSIVDMPESQPGTFWAILCKFTNNTKEEHTYTPKRIDEVEKDPQRHERYYGKGCTPGCTPTKESWVELEKPFTLKPGESKDLRMKVTIPEKAARGKTYEELVFFTDEKGKTDFLRARTIIAQQPLAEAPKP